MEIEFKEWPKIPRGVGEVITVTEKIDGTNACVIIQDGGVVGAQSRSRLIYPGDDNFGFASWVDKNKAELAVLGDGYHYGEWAGEGIQKNHHNIVGKKFFLFNTARWNKDNPNLPECCDVVPVLYNGDQYNDWQNDIMRELWITAKNQGYHPEGVVVWFHKTRRYEKITFENAEGKWKS